MRVETEISLIRENILHYIISSSGILGPPTLSYSDFIFSHLNYCLFFLLSFFFSFNINFYTYNSLSLSSSISSHCLIIELASLKYNQSPSGFDT